jgi:UDP-glucose 4-epimerase
VGARRVLITGVASYFGTELARRLEADPDVEYVAGLDSLPPRRPLAGTELIRLDLRDPALVRRLPATRVDTIVHNQIVRHPGRGLSPQAAHDVNVIGSLGLLAACERTPSLEAIVVRGSAGIYGSEPAASQFLTEDMAGLGALRTGFQRDVAEIDTMFWAFARRHAGVTCTMLRYQPSLGPSVDSQLTRYLGLPLCPTYLGFDPRIQVVHERDALEALVAAVRAPVDGPVNVASPGTIGLSRMLRMAKKAALPLPPPLFGSAVGAARRLGAEDLSPDLRRLLRYGRAVDTRRLVEEVGYRPRFTTEGAVRDFARPVHRPGDSGPPSARRAAPA